MKSIKYFFLILMSYLSINLSAQSATGTLDLQILQDVQSFPLSNFLNFSPGFDIENTNLGRMMQLTITANVEQVILKGGMSWTSTDGNYSGQVFDFVSKPITLDGGGGSYSLFVDNTDFGDGKRIEISEGNTDGDLIKENANRGRLSGIYSIGVSLYDAEGTIQLASASETLVASNPTANFTIFNPQITDQNNFNLSWSPSTDPDGYIVSITENPLSSYDDIESSSPNVNAEVQINDVNIGGTVPILRAFTQGATYYVSVFAKYPTMFEGHEYFPAENNNLEINIPGQSGGTGGQSPSSDPDFDEETGYVAPIFAITEPVAGATIEVTDQLFSSSITWEAVTDATSYDVVISYVGASGSDAEINARSSAVSEKQQVPGTQIASLNVISGNTKSISVSLSDASTVPQVDSSYIAIGVFANNPDGSWRSSNIRFVLLTEPESTGQNTQTAGNQQQQQQEQDVDVADFQDLLNQPGVTVQSATDEEGNTYTQSDIQNLINQITNGTISGTLRVVTSSSSGN